MELKSSAFENGEKIPVKYTCEGENISPPLEISDVPSAAKSLALIMFDPDIPQVFKEQKGIEGWDHWSVWNIKPDVTEIVENAKDLGVEGKQTSGVLGYTGPCPPKKYEPKEHRYFFWVYALDRVLNLKEGASKEELEKAMEGYVMDKAELIGVYEKTG